MERSIKILFIFFIGLILLSVYIGYSSSDLCYGYGTDYACMAGILYIGLFTFLFSIFGAIFLKKAGFKMVSVIFFFILFLILPVGISLISLIYFTNKIHAEFRINQAKDMTKNNQEYKKQMYDSLKLGKVIPVGSNLQYICETCGYSVLFPKDWGFAESSGDFVLTTVNYKESLDRTDGQRFHIDDYPNEGETDIDTSKWTDLMSTNKPEVTTMKVSGLDATIRKQLPEIRNNNYAINGDLVVKFKNDKKNFTIRAGFNDEQDLDKNLAILLDNFRVIH